MANHSAYFPGAATESLESGAPALRRMSISNKRTWRGGSKVKYQIAKLRWRQSIAATASIQANDMTGDGLYSLRHPLSHTDPGPTIKTPRGADVKTFRLFKLPFLSCVLLGGLLLSPACRAQSEIAPDFFDGPNTQPFEKVNAPAPSEANKLQKTVVVPAARLAHGIKVGNRGEITLAQSMKVGDRVLKPGTYVVQHRLSHDDHFVRFLELKLLDYSMSDTGSNDTFTVGENAWEMKCRVEPATEGIKQTTVYTVTENGTKRITKVAIRGEDVVHVF